MLYSCILPRFIHLCFGDNTKSVEFPIVWTNNNDEHIHKSDIAIHIRRDQIG